MPVNSTSKWFRGLALTLGPLALILAVAWLAVPADSLAGVVTLAADEEDLAREYYFQAAAMKGAFLGVSLEEETEHEEGGARVTHVADESPAAKAGLQEGDIIVGFEGGTIRGPVGLTKQIHARKPGDSVALAVLRDGKRQTLVAELGDRSESWRVQMIPELRALENIEIPDMPDIEWHVQDSLRDLGQAYELLDCDEDEENCGYRFFSSWSGRPLLGVQLVEVTPELRRHLGAGEEAGVLVSKVVAGSAAESAGIRVGDLIVAVDGEETSDSRDLRGELRDKTGKTFQLEVIRDGTPMSIEVTIPEPDTERPTGPRAGVMRPMRAPRVEVVAAPRLHVAPVAPVAAPRVRVAPVAPVAPAEARPAAPAPAAAPAPVERRTYTEMVRRVEADRGIAEPARDRALRQYEAARLAAERTQERVRERVVRQHEGARLAAERFQERARDRAAGAYERALRQLRRREARPTRAPVLL